MRIDLLTLLLLAAVTSSKAAETTPVITSAVFKASASKFQSGLIEVRKALKNIKLEKVPISYTEGKLIDKNVELANQNLDLETALLNKVLETENLADEIDLLSTTQEIGHLLQDISSSLLAVELHDQRSVNMLVTWTDGLQTETKPVETFYELTYRFSISRAAELERRNCDKKVDNP